MGQHRKTNSVLLALALAQEAQVYERFLAMGRRLVVEGEHLRLAAAGVLEQGGKPLDPGLYEPVLTVVEGLLTHVNQNNGTLTIKYQLPQ